MFTKDYLESQIDQLVFRAVSSISPDALALLEQARDRESNPTAKSILSSMVEDVAIAREKKSAVCQSPGYPTVYLSLCPEAMEFDLQELFAKALVRYTKAGYLRPSLVDALTRKGTGDNSGRGLPNMEYDCQPGQGHLDMIISFKGCGAELGNAMEIVIPAELGENLEGVKKLVLETCVKAGGKPCPPCAIGVGIGGQMDVCCRLSRKAISVRRWDDIHPDPSIAALERELLEQVNSLGLGAAGIGGDTYALAVKVDHAATHTAIEPVAVNFSCWVARRAGVRLYPDGRRETLL